MDSEINAALGPLLALKISQDVLQIKRADVDFVANVYKTIIDTGKPPQTPDDARYRVEYTPPKTPAYSPSETSHEWMVQFLDIQVTICWVTITNKKGAQSVQYPSIYVYSTIDGKLKHDIAVFNVDIHFYGKYDGRPRGDTLITNPDTQFYYENPISFAVLLFTELFPNNPQNEMFQGSTILEKLNKLVDVKPKLGGRKLKKASSMVATTSKHQGRIIYTGPRGGRYVKVKGEFKRLAA